MHLTCFFCFVNNIVFFLDLTPSLSHEVSLSLKQLLMSTLRWVLLFWRYIAMYKGTCISYFPSADAACLLKLILVHFQISKYDIEESIKREMSGDLRDGMTSIGKKIIVTK